MKDRETNLTVDIRRLSSSGNLEIRWRAADARYKIRKAEYSLNGGEWTIAAPVGKLSDSMELDYELALKNAAAGEHAVAVRVEDEYANQATGKTVIE